MAMSLEQANYCDNLKTGNIEVALLRCDVISQYDLWGEMDIDQKLFTKFKADQKARFIDEMIDEHCFEAAKVVNTKQLETMGYEP